MVIVLMVRDVSTGSRIAELFCKAEVDDIDDVVFTSRLCLFGYDEVCGFDVAVDKVA